MRSKTSQPDTQLRSVEIVTHGRGGSIYYREGSGEIRFDWEFAASPAIAIIFGPAANSWSKQHRWATDRQAEIYDFVGSEVVRQQTPNGGFQVDLDAGTIEISNRPDRHTPAYERFVACLPPVSREWREGEQYDVAALRRMTAAERSKITAMLAARDVTWREVEALAAIGTPEANAALVEASRHHLWIDTRLAAADALHRKKRLPDLDGFIAREIRMLSNPREGLERALSMAARNPSDTVKQALLWASYNATECAPPCAHLLLVLTGTASEPFDSDVEQMLAKLGLHNSSFDRQAAFADLCRRVGMTLDEGIVP